MTAPAPQWPEIARAVERRRRLRRPLGRIVGWKLLGAFRDVGVEHDGTLINPHGYDETAVKNLIEDYLRQEREQRGLTAMTPFDRDSDRRTIPAVLSPPPRSAV
jgi:hypothetical protein